MLPDQTSAFTLSALEPDLPLTLDWRRARFSPRNLGSFQQNLRTPSRLPDVHRAYVAGDPASRIDWHAYARTDSLLIREVREEASAKVQIILECVDSMFWPSEEVKLALPRAALTKWEVAVRIAFHLFHTHVRQGDVTSVLLKSGNHLTDLPTITLREKATVVSSFSQLKDQAFTKAAFDDLQRNVTGLAQASDACDVRYLIGDFLELTEDEFQTLVGRGYCIGLHSLSPFELAIDWQKDDVSYFDREMTQVELPGKILHQQDRYKHALKDWLQKWQGVFENLGGAYYRVSEQTRIPDLHRFLHATSGALG